MAFYTKYDVQNEEFINNLIEGLWSYKQIDTEKINYLEARIYGDPNNLMKQVWMQKVKILIASYNSDHILRIRDAIDEGDVEKLNSFNLL